MFKFKLIASLLKYDERVKLYAFLLKSSHPSLSRSEATVLAVTESSQVDSDNLASLMYQAAKYGPEDHHI